MTKTSYSNLVYGFLFALSMMLLQGCRIDDPEPVNEEEVITTVRVTIVHPIQEPPIVLEFLDPDGEQGSAVPAITVSGSLKAASQYTATITLLNETVEPAEDISEEVVEEGTDHLVCFDSSQNIEILYNDEDENGLPLGLTTSWVTGAAGPGEVTIALRHQAGTKTGDCPGAGESDVEVTFNVIIE